MDIDGKTILVTGANSGLGASVVERMVAGGAKVVGLDLSTINGDRFGDNVEMVSADVTSATDVAKAVAIAKSRFGGVHGLVNCAGVAPGQKIVGRDGPHELELFSKAVSINLIGTFNTMRLAAEAMTEGDAGPDGERGVVINTASVAAFDGQIGQSAYAASKGGVVGLSLPMARDLAREGIRVMAIAPGSILTPMLMGLPQEVQDGLAQDVTCPKRLGRPEEYARLAQFIVECDYLNGEVIRIDGALRMQ